MKKTILFTCCVLLLACHRYDVAADVAFALGLETPQVWVGRPARTSALYDGTLLLEKSAVVIAKLFSASGESPGVSAHYRITANSPH